uniref:Uncharacterized protein n=1 Tax=Paramoeba aestuarina TaxID=180227 RepID=A0A7S4KUA7_9EUKA|mmetsp:Transcript_25664/g.40000  ORF Transcript_25664/g.40000 Transcript_25664/m.40000 type:complete len:113 (+) Transcript_25664:103-441(+)
MSAFPELLGFKEINKDVTPEEAAAFIEQMQKNACDATSEEKKDLLEKMADSLRNHDNPNPGIKVESKEGESSSKRIVFGDDDDDEMEEEKKEEEGEEEKDESSSEEEDSDSD